MRDPLVSIGREPLKPTVAARAVAEELLLRGEIEASQLLKEMIARRVDADSEGVILLTDSSSSAAEATVVEKKRKKIFSTQDGVGEAINFDNSLKRVLFGEWRNSIGRRRHIKACMFDCFPGQGPESTLQGGVGVHQVGSVIVFEVQQDLAAFNISDASVAIGGKHFSPVWILLSGKGHQSCIVRVDENSWVHANDSTITEVSMDRISDLLKRSFKSVVISVDSSLISSCCPRVVQRLENTLGRYCFINCLVQFFCIFERQYSPVSVSDKNAAGRIWKLLRGCFNLASDDTILLGQQQEMIHTEFCDLFQLEKPEGGADAIDLFNVVISHAAADFGFFPWEVAATEIGCCCGAPAVPLSSTTSCYINVPVHASGHWLPGHTNWKPISLFDDNPTVEQLIDRVLASRPPTEQQPLMQLPPSMEQQPLMQQPPMLQQQHLMQQPSPMEQQPLMQQPPRMQQQPFQQEAAVASERRPEKQSPRSRRREKIKSGAVELERLWEQHLEGRFFDDKAEISGFADQAGLINEDTVKTEFRALDYVPAYFHHAMRDASELRESATRLFHNSESIDGELSSWYNDNIIGCLCTILRAAIKSSPTAETIAVLDSAFLASRSGRGVELDPEELIQRLRRVYTPSDLQFIEKVLVVVCVPHDDEGSTKPNHFALLELSLLERTVMVYDSLMDPLSSLEALNRRFKRHVQALQLLFDSIQQ